MHRLCRNKSLVAIILCIFSLVFCASNVYADGWISPPSTGTISPNPPVQGSTSTDCVNHIGSWGIRDDCHGASWIYYRYIGDPKATGNVRFFPNYVSSSRRDNPGKEISNTCKETGGFWHLGHDVSRYEPDANGNYYDPIQMWARLWDWSPYGGFWWTGLYGAYSDMPYLLTGAGHADSMTLGTVDEWDIPINYWAGEGGNGLHSYITNFPNNTSSIYDITSRTGPLGHRVYLTNGLTVDTNNYFEAVVYGDYETVKNAYNETLRIVRSGSNGSTYTAANGYPDWTNSTYPSIWSFCASDPVAKDAEFSGETTSSGDGSSQGFTDSASFIKADSYSFGFSHVITRTGGDATYKPGSKYTVQYRIGSDGAWQDSAKTGTTTKANNIGESETINYSYGDSIKPNQKVTICSRIKYESVVHSNGDTSTTSYSSEKCRYAQRTQATFEGHIYPYIGTSKKDADKNVEQRVTTDYVTFSFQDWLKRTDDCTKGAGGEVESIWSASADNKDSLSNKKAKRSCGDTGGNVTTYTYSNQYLGPGQRLTKCNTFKFNNTVEPTEASHTTTRNACITVYRNSANKFIGTVTPSVDGEAGTANSLENRIVVPGTSHTLVFVDNIKRGDDGAGGSISSAWSSKSDDLANDSGSTRGLAEGESQDVKQYNYNIDLDPGVTKKKCSHMIYENEVRYDGTSTKPADACQEIYRKPAYFEGSIVMVTVNGETESSNLNDNHLQEVDNEGYVKIRFKNVIRRKDDGSGESVGSAWTTYVKDHMGTKTGSVKESVVNLEEEASETVSTYTYTYHLNYGETITICDTMVYYNEINNGTHHQATTKKCIRIHREGISSEKCTGVDYGVRGADGQWHSVNGGIIRSVNATTGETKTSVSSYANFSAPNNIIDASDLWARPGDSVRFEFVGCAGGQYMNYLAHRDYRTELVKVNYQITGSSNSRNSTASDKNTRYTFGDELSFNNDNISSFVGGEKVEKGRLSGPEAVWANPSTDKGSTYSCSINGALQLSSGHYQVAGNITYHRNQTPLMTYPCATNTLDVGSTITNTLSFTGMNVHGVREVGTTDVKPITLGGADTGEESYQKQYELAYENLGTIKANANIRIPYNYKLQPYIRKSGGDTGVIYSGSTIRLNTGVSVAARKNDVFPSAGQLDTYATITKPTSVIIKYTIYRGSTTTSGVAHSDTLLTLTGQRFNSSGNLAGMHDGNTSYYNGGSSISAAYSDELKININYDTAIGTLVCFEISAYPADSHDAYDKDTVSGAGNNNIALSETGGSSATTIKRNACYNVAKKPSFSVEGGNAYSGGTSGFVTSTTQRKINNTTYNFGSWSEYGIYGAVALGDLRGMASGATYGYDTRNHGVGVNAVRSTFNNTSTTANTNTCTLSTQTYTNSNCTDLTIQSIGLQGMGQRSATNFRDRIVSRYTSGTAEMIPESYDSSYPNRNYIWKDRDDSNKCLPEISNANQTCLTVANVNYANLAPFIVGGVANRDENGSAHARINSNIPVYFGTGSTHTDANGNETVKNLYLNQNFSNDTSRNFTNVYEFGTLVLDGNIIIGKYGDGQPANGDPVLTSGSQIRERIIVAKKVLITGNVTRVDAMIIADEVDTCAYANFRGFSTGKRIVANVTDPNTQQELNSSVCNKAIVFNAPVIAKKILLHRTYGGGYSGSSYNMNYEALRGEIFYLRPDFYYWSYSQMQRYSQAMTVSQRELPTRY